MQHIHQIISYIANQPTATWTTIGSYLGGSTLVATLLQIIKHKLNITEAKKLITFLLGLLSFLTVFADYILSSTTQNPTVLGRNTALVAGVAVFIHRFAVSPAYDKIVGGLSSLISDASAYRATVAPQSTTAGLTPEVPATTETFSV